MPQPTKSRCCPSHSNRRVETRLQDASGRGYALLILMMALTLLLIALTTALPDIYTQRQRDREEELIFRGNEYARAILLYRRQFSRFPSSVDDLVKKTNGVRFLRHAYKDPMTKSGKWRFIHANAAGAVLDSKTLPSGQSLLQNSNNPGKGNSADTKDKPANDESASDDTQGDATTDQSKPDDSSQAAGDETKGGFIIGVASSSKKKSIRVWNEHSRYDEWEFLGVNNQAPGAVGTQPGAGTDLQGQPGSPNETGVSPHATNPQRPM